MGKLLAICISKKKGTEKKEVKEAVLIPQFGIEGDAHAGNWHRQVSLLSLEKIEDFRKKGAEVAFGAFGEIWWWKALTFRIARWEVKSMSEKRYWS